MAQQGHDPPAMRLTVVSCPATSSRMQVESSSPSLSTGPPSSGHQPAEQVLTRAASPLGQQLEEVPANWITASSRWRR